MPTSRSGRLDRPFSREVLAQARDVVAGYRITLDRQPDDTFVGSSVELPFVMADGATKAQCLGATEEALIAAVATLLERGETPPSREGEGRRTLQINLRVSAREKFRLEEAAKKAGFRSVSDFIRASALRAGPGSS